MNTALAVRLCCKFALNCLNSLEVAMTIVPGTPVKLPDGRDGVVIPPPVRARDRVLVKVKGGRKAWFSIAECTPTFSAPYR